MVLSCTGNDDVDLVSEAVAPGTVQVLPGGRPILFSAIAKTIGGYQKSLT
jgi:allophanate hydrolase subunit 2